MPYRSGHSRIVIAALAGVIAAAGCAKKKPGPTDAGIPLAEWETNHVYPNCAYSPGQLAQDTLPGTWPTGKQIPIDHVVLVMHENRSFDHYLGQLTNGADVAPPGVTNPDADGGTVARFHQTIQCFNDTNHDWSGSHEAFDDGGMDGFVLENDPGGERAMGYYDQTDLPFFYALAQTFAMSDRHFCSLMGPTYPNRMFYEAGTSFGITTSGLPPWKDASGNPYPNVMSEMDAAKVNWQAYIQDIPAEILFAQTYANDITRFGAISDFMTAAQAGTLAEVSFVEASDGTTNYPIAPDEHPPAVPAVGQLLLSQIVQAVMTSPQWSSTALIVTYDENGGLYDHVPPPMACEPDNLPVLPGDAGFAFNQYGFRVPMIVVSPYAKRGYVSHHVTDHTSILRFVEARFGLPAMTKRDANAEPLYDLFDFANPDLSVPQLPAVSLDSTVDNGCIAQYPQTTSGF